MSLPERLQGLAPVVADNSRLLILGSFPGVASLQAQQYYGHPRNQFWPLLGAIWQLDLKAMAYAERLSQLRLRGLGLWDVVASCSRQGSLDADIREPAFNDLSTLKQIAPSLRLVAHNGAESAKVMKRVATLGLPVVKLPSSSPANASWSFDRKLQAWRAAFQQAGICPHP